MQATPRARRQQGGSLLEVLITMLILSFGLLALARLTAVSLQYAKMSQFQSVGTELAAAYGERMRANISGFRQNLYDQTGVDATASVAVADACAGAACTPAEQAAADKAAWLQELRSRLPDGAAFVKRDAVNALAVDLWVIWNEPRLATSATGTLSTASAGDCPAAAVARLAADVIVPRCMYFRLAL